jgi:CBS domain containing-hemolysin-like protein
MVPRVRIVGLPIGSTAETGASSTASHTIPVFDGDLDHISGMLHVKDVLKRLIGGESIAVSDVRPMPFVPDTAPLDDVLTTMQRAHAHPAVVIDEHGGTAVLASTEDLIEEVVGDIDEGVPKEPPRAGPDGSVRAAARCGSTSRAALSYRARTRGRDSVSGLRSRGWAARRSSATWSTTDGCT